ncbi:MAG: cob(I)yrinic acid a,c-diamide adenosyltransferase [Deltaproteobacteria bacterium]|nr:cob(I)yrinic acid a,c-diamide adenosyltransferase [Deltaproteobacteria bacterium]
MKPDHPDLNHIPGRLLIFTGDGKGKTTAALGMALRAGGHGQKVLILQFIKANQYSGELAALRLLPGVELVQMGLGFVVPPDDPRFGEHRRRAEEALERAAEALRSGVYDLVILDEIITAVTKNLLPEEKVAAALRRRNGNGVLVLTGRGAGPGLLALADTVTEMKNVKHGLQTGWKAQEGVEF